MNKAELAAEIAARTNTTKKSVEEMLAAFTDVVTEVVAKGERVTLVGFGTFLRRDRQARETNNPQKPGEKIPKYPLSAYLPSNLAKSSKIQSTTSNSCTTNLDKKRERGLPLSLLLWLYRITHIGACGRLALKQLDNGFEADILDIT